MIFTSITFLVFFTTLLILLACFRGQSARMWILLVASYIFYGWWDYRFLSLLFLVSFASWWLGLRLAQSETPQARRFYLIVSLVCSLGVLAVFKYLSFFMDSFASAFNVTLSPALSIILPVGISFYVFQVVSYTIDIYRKHLEPTRSLPQFLLYVAFFPQLVAGPIVRAVDFLPQLEQKITVNWTNFVIGTQLFIGGALQKVIVADTLGGYVDAVFSQPTLYSGGTLWLGMFAFAGQIFGDFSGYSLMAIGIARMLGFELPENFRMPYISRSITEFWRRWHISLSSWLRDYLYVSLGGNRKGNFRTYVNLMITMVLGGLWHGASWNFVIWGAMHGLALAVHKVWMGYTGGKSWGAVYEFAAWLLTLVFVCLLWIPFRADSFDISLQFLAGMFSGQSGIVWMHPQVIAVLVGLVIWHGIFSFAPKISHVFPAVDISRFRIAYFLSLSVLLIFVFAPVTSSPFVYFQF